MCSILLLITYAQLILQVTITTYTALCTLVLLGWVLQYPVNTLTNSFDCSCHIKVVELVQLIIYVGSYLSTSTSYYYHIAGKFGEGKFDSFRAFGETKFGKLVDQPIVS